MLFARSSTRGIVAPIMGRGDSAGVCARAAIAIITPMAASALTNTLFFIVEIYAPVGRGPWRSSTVLISAPQSTRTPKKGCIISSQVWSPQYTVLFGSGLDLLFGELS